MTGGNQTRHQLLSNRPRRSCDKHSHHRLLHRGFYLHPTRQDDSPDCDTSEHPGTRKRGWQCWGTAPTFAPERIGSGALSPKGCPATQRELCGEAARDLPPPLRQPCVADITGRAATPPVLSARGPPTLGSGHGAQPSQRRCPSALVSLRRAPYCPSRSVPPRVPRPRPRSPEPPAPS